MNIVMRNGQGCGPLGTGDTLVYAFMSMNSETIGSVEIDAKQLWENVLVEIELEISKANFSTWFKNTRVLKYEDGVVLLSVPNQFVKDWLSAKYHKLILKCLRRFSPSVRGVEYAIAKAERRGEDAAVRTVFPTPELPLGEYYINKSDNLNPRYTFESFVVGSFNELAYAAAQAVIQKPGIAYNPLFFYGGTGRGKTHLIQAIGNQIKKASPAKKIYYVTSEKFAVDYTTSLQNTNVNSFKEKYRQFDVFVMDDIQFLAGKEKTQEELFHLFNALYDNNKQIVFSSDMHPNFIQNLEDRLKSRFSAGMVVDIQEPDHESRIAILKTKAVQSKFSLPDEIAEFLAGSIQGNVRELEGALNAVICQAQLKGRMPSLAEVRILARNNAKPRRSISTKEVIKKVSEFYNIDEQSIYEKTRRKEVVRPRQIIMYILREDLQVSYPTIGQRLGGRDHTTVIHSCEKIKNDLKFDSDLTNELQQIRMLLK